jgi:hypothetical protein
MLHLGLPLFSSFAQERKEQMDQHTNFTDCSRIAPRCLLDAVRILRLFLSYFKDLRILSPCKLHLK